MAWFNKAAEQGDVYAQANLGLMYEEGLGTQRNYNTAARWYGQAAEGNHELSQRKLAHLYETGQGVPQDNVKAYTWYAIAGVWQGGDTLAMDDPRLKLSTRMSPEQIEEANQAAMTWWEKHFKVDDSAPVP